MSIGFTSACIHGKESGIADKPPPRRSGGETGSNEKIEELLPGNIQQIEVLNFEILNWLVTAMPIPICPSIGRREMPFFRTMNILINKTGHKSTFVPIFLRRAGTPDPSPS
ncbi:hypothetical protein ACNRBS_09325 [Ralstonia pseudosolanacearum]|uniref:hypothetical protein n=1 Tax=Ralstonia pseudosolanacearum TaxID=1310165 RepID=UPI0018D0C428|nr:hypothetical protein [Ralstonia pseudosolanacearum]